MTKEELDTKLEKLLRQRRILYPALKRAEEKRDQINETVPNKCGKDACSCNQCRNARTSFPPYMNALEELWNIRSKIENLSTQINTLHHMDNLCQYSIK